VSRNPRWFGWPLSKKDLEREVDEEIALHLEMRAEDLQRNVRDSRAAHEEAKRRFGDVGRYREEMIRLRTGHVHSQERALFWDEVRQDIRFGLRQLVRKPALPLMIVALLAIGVGANTAIFSVVKAVLLEPLPFPSPEQLTILWETKGNSSESPASYPNFVDWREQSESFEEIGAASYWFFNLTGKEGPQRVFGGLISAGLFELLGVEPELGRMLLPEEDHPDGPKVVLLSSGLWKSRYGGDPEILGESILINGEPFTVIGVMPAGFEVPSPWLIGRQSDLWLSLTIPKMNRPLLEDRDTHWMVAMGRLKSGVSLGDAQQEMNVVSERLARQYQDSNRDEGIRVTPLHGALVGRAGGQLLTLHGAAGLVLLIACGNVAGLLMARATTRQTEVAVRSALGASRSRLIRQLLVENVPLCLLGGALGLLLAVAGIGMLRSILPTNISRIETVTFDGWVFAFTLGLSLTTGVLFSLAPAWAAVNTNLGDTLKQGRGALSMGAGRNRARRVFVVAEFATALILAHAAALMLQSYVELRNREYGFDTEQVLTLGISIQGSEYQDTASIRRFYDRVTERVEALPGVHYAAATSKLPLEGGQNSTVNGADGHDFSQTEGPTAEVSIVTSDYFETMRIPLVAGGTFTERDSMMNSPNPAIINQRFAEKLWPDEDPIGKRFNVFSAYPSIVVGVVGNVRQFGPEREPIPEIYMPLSPTPPEIQTMFKMVRFLVVRTDGDPLSYVEAIRSEVMSVDETQPIAAIRTTADVLGSAMARRRFNTLLIGIFAFIGLTLVSAGVYGVMAFFVAQRRHEIGIRMAMGADWLTVQKLVLGQGLKLVVIGVAVGLAGVFATAKMTESMVYGISPTDPVTVLGGLFVLVAIGLLGSLVPALRATRVDPILALREE
jgi:putative ABC transport system permease protein